MIKKIDYSKFHFTYIDKFLNMLEKNSETVTA